MGVERLDYEDSNLDIYNGGSGNTVLTHTPSATVHTICQAYVALGDDSDPLSGTGGDYELVIAVGGQIVEPSPQTVTFSTAVRVGIWTASFPVPANQSVVISVTSPNSGETDVDVKAHLFDVAHTSFVGADNDTLKSLSDQIDVITTTVRGEPGQVNPPEETAPLLKLDYLYKLAINKKEFVLSENLFKLYNYAGDNVDQQAAFTDAAGTALKGVIVIGT